VSPLRGKRSVDPKNPGRKEVKRQCRNQETNKEKGERRSRGSWFETNEIAGGKNQIIRIWNTFLKGREGEILMGQGVRKGKKPPTRVGQG